DQSKVVESNKSIETIDFTKDPLDCLSNTDSLELSEAIAGIGKEKPELEIGNGGNSKESELEVSNTKDPELENEKEPNT
ncbi:21674_t:CDS:1, partial [Dentiscutata erythropus]